MGHNFEEQTQKLLNGTENAPTQITNGVAPQPSISFVSSAPVIMTNLPTENTPLLSTPVPHVEEGVHCSNERDCHSTWVIFQEELGILTKYTLPIFATHLFEFSFNIASVVAIGHISTTALAAATLAFMTASVSGYAIVQGLVSALDTLLPAAWTSSHPQLVGLWSQRMLVVTATIPYGMFPVFMIWFNAESILLLLRQDPEVAHLAAVYLRWSSFGTSSIFFQLRFANYRRYFQSQGLFAVPTKIILVVAPINALLELLWGPESVRIGFIGAPIATSISFNLISISSVIYGIFYVEKTAWHPISMRSFTGLDCLVKLGLAGVGQTASEWWSWELNNCALGPAALASQSVLLISSSCTFQAPFALSLATRIGNLLGEKQARRAGVSAYAAIVLAVAISAIWSTMFISFRQSWAYIVNDDPEVVTLVASVLPVVAMYQVFDGIAAVTSGVLRAQGKQVSASGYYVIGIPFGVWLTFKMGMGLVGLWVGLTVSLVYCSVWGTYLCIATDWQKEVKKVSDRLAIENKNEAEENGSSHL
ncbi:mate-domain-containing protein [Suillus subalutaceus]|uniref:mate-domain-containing protein n=1 Tax=Suillus subalutaceus TaxID=48586 RepID=UPI001B861E6A|nr:mate-domain-containing protein [Suillus subalutaceus]KAG1836277.1 mate-domain-containing protein [Suillus subalutaceus]